MAGITVNGQQTMHPKIHAESCSSPDLLNEFCVGPKPGDPKPIHHESASWAADEPSNEAKQPADLTVRERWRQVAANSRQDSGLGEGSARLSPPGTDASAHAPTLNFPGGGRAHRCAFGERAMTGRLQLPIRARSQRAQIHCERFALR